MVAFGVDGMLNGKVEEGTQHKADGRVEVRNCQHFDDVAGAIEQVGKNDKRQRQMKQPMVYVGWLLTPVSNKEGGNQQGLEKAKKNKQIKEAYGYVRSHLRQL